jgi:molybdopterin synthase catalytic subunit
MMYLTRTPISLESLVRTVAGPDCGGTCTFLGTVRGDGGVTGIEYSAYDEMVTTEFDRILGEARERWHDARIAVQHRIGLIPVGEASIAIVAAATHRDAAFAACRFIIEEVKKRLPIWKKELRADGAAEWVKGCSHGP